MARRHAGLLRSQHDRTSSRRRWPRRAGDHRAGGYLHRDRRHTAAGGTQLHHQPERHLGARAAEIRQARHLQHRLRRQHPHLRHHAGQGNLRASAVGGGALLPAEHAAAERARCRCCRAAFVPRSAPGSIATTAVPTSGTPGALGDTCHGALNGVNIFPRTALFDTATLAGELTWMQWAKVTQNEAVFKGSRIRNGSTPIDKPTRNYLRPRAQLHADVVPGLAGRRSVGAGRPGARAYPATLPSLFGGNENAGNWSAGVAADIYQKYRVDLKLQRLLRRLLDRPHRLHRPALMGVPNGTFARSPTAAGYRSRSRPHSDEEHESCSARHCWPRASRPYSAPRALAAVSADEAKQLGTTLTAVGAEKAGNKDGTIPEYTGGIKPPADFKAGSGIRPDPFASEKPRLMITGKERPRSADKLTEGTKELLKRYPTMRVDVYPTHRTVAVPQRILDNTAKNATGAKTTDGGVALENVLPGYPFPIPKTGSEAIWNHLLRYSGIGYDNSRYENWNVDAAGVPTLAVSGGCKLGVADFRCEENGTHQRQRSLLVRQAPIRRAGPTQRRSAAVGRCRQPAEAAAQGMAVPAGPAPREARARPRLRHAEPRRGRRGNLRRRLGVQRRDRPLRLEAHRQEGDVRALQRAIA